MDKKKLSEADICAKFLNPALDQAGWDEGEQVYREYTLRPGRVVVRGQKASRDKKSVLRADYVLFYKTSIPLAVIEAKDNSHAVGAGMAQAINYAELLGVPFSFASNGDGFVFRDATLASGTLETNLTLDEFPTPAALWERLCTWKGWTPEVRRLTEQPYAPSKTPTSGRTAAPGSLLMVCMGTIGKCNLVNRHCSFNQQSNSATLFAGVPKFLLIVTRARYFQELAWSNSSSTTISMLNKGKWEALPIPLPPLAEQQRIVARVEELRRLCAELRERLTEARSTQGQLADALVAQAIV